MATGSQGAYTLLVANFSRPMPSLLYGADPDTGGPTKTRSGFVFGHVENLGFSNTLTQHGQARSLVTNTVNVQIDPFEAAPSGTVTVSSNSFVPGGTVLIVGPFELVANRDFVPGGGTAATATAIGAAINNLRTYSANVVGSDVTVTGPRGAAPASLAFAAVYRTGIRNFTFTYPSVGGFLGYAASPLHVDELPPGTPNYSAIP